MDVNRKIRVLGKGNTAKDLKKTFKNALLYDDNDFAKYDLKSNEVTVVSPGIPPFNDMVKKSKNIISEYDLFKEMDIFNIWISGTNGKTTTTQMTQHLLEKYGSVCGGNIGIGLGALKKNVKIWILETSSFTLHYTKFATPDIYVLLPITQDHISWHGTFEKYKEDKLKPLNNMNEHQIAILPYEFRNYKTSAFKIIYKDTNDLCEYFNINSKKINFKEPFLMDAVLAMACEKIIFDKIEYNKINDCKIDRHKVEEFYDKKNRKWIDDSKATNVDATIKALISYRKEKIHLILGGDDKGADLNPLFEEIKNMDIIIYAIGANTLKIINYAKEYKINSFKCDNLELAVKKINKNLSKNDIAMLSPAAASLDQFSSYKQRGEEFKKNVFSLSLD